MFMLHIDIANPPPPPPTHTHTFLLKISKVCSKGTGTIF